MRAALVLIPLVSVLGFVACLKRSSSELSHDAGKPVIDPYGKQWHVATDAEYVDLVNGGSPFSSIDASQLLPATDPMVARVQYWMDAIDGMLRRDHPADLKDVPKPVAKVMKSTSANAFVMDNKICLDYSLTFDTPREGDVVKKVTFDREDLGINESVGTCHKSRMSLDDQRAYLEWWVKAFDGCSLTFADNVATASAGCAKYASKVVAGGERIMVRQTSHFISFYTEIFRHLSEAEMVSVIAHELAHYYRSHGTADGKLYNHFYRVDQHTTGTRPAADASLADLGNRVLEASKKRLPDMEMGDISDLAERARIITLMTQAIDEHLGQYTVEQEADELAVEWMAKLGLALDPAIIAQIKISEVYLKDFRNASVYGWVSGKECRAAFENKWIDNSGKPMMVPVAAWNDIHHSPCFRAFNIDREITAHGYSRSGKEAQGQGESWDALVKSVLQ